jgi:hypothetical protein
VDTIQSILGDVLLVLAGLGLVLFAIILLMVQANVIVCLGGKLTRSLRSGDGADHRMPADEQPRA